VSNLLADAGVRLAVLTACKSAVVAGQSVFSGMGPALIQAGVPAVVAMQFSVTVDAAKSFTRSFYLALAQYAPVTKAMGLARAALFVDETAWYRPVLYLRMDAKNPEGKLFARKSKPKPAAEDISVASTAPILPTPQPVARPKLGEPCSQPIINRTDLRNAIVQHFSLEELEALCADVQQDLEDRGIKDVPVNLEIVGGSSKPVIVLNLIFYLERRGSLGCLEVAARRTRPTAFS
jgi:hypothetical protein